MGINMRYLKIISINLGIILVAVFVVWISVLIDEYFGLIGFKSNIASILGLTFVLFGLFFRFWASDTFYKNKVKVLWVSSQKKLLIEGPFKFTRNPLYIGIVSIALGVVILFGSYTGLLLAIIFFFIWDLWLKYFEEKDLEKKFGKNYRKYKKNIPRWIGLKRLGFFFKILLISLLISFLVSLLFLR